MVLAKEKITFYDEILLIKAAHNGSVEAEDVLYSYHKSRLEHTLHKYNLPQQIELSYRMSIHKFNIESNVPFINFASWFIQNILERRCVLDK